MSTSARRAVVGWCLAASRRRSAPGPALGARASLVKQPAQQRFPGTGACRTFCINVKKERLTVVLDLDECLVHSQFEDMGRSRGLAAQVSREVEPGGWSVQEDAPDVRHRRVDFFHLDLEEEGGQVKVNTRPHLDEALLRLSDEYDLHVFTASVESYANPILDALDPSGQFFKKRFFRTSCKIIQDIYLKDLTVIKKDLSRIVLVDNNPLSFIVQPSNGIPVPSWYDDPEDKALKHVVDLIENELHHLDDVRPHLNGRFKLEHRLFPIRKQLAL